MSFTRQLLKSTGFFLLLGCATATWAQGGPGDGSEPAEVKPSQSPVLPDLELAPIAKFATNALYLNSVSADVTELERQAAAAKDAGMQIGFLLAAANVVLAYEMEPACTGAALHLPGAADAPSAEASLNKADHLLNRAQSILDSEKGEADGLAEDLRGSSAQLEQLQAFLNALAAYLSDGQAEDDATKARQASSRLSILLEDGDERVVAAAMLWHSMLRSRHGDPERAARMLPLALSRPSQKSLPFGFFARVLRCRLLADRGSYAVALGLLSQLEEKSREWFVSEVDQENALRAITVASFQVLDQWRARLSQPEEVEQRDWCEERMRWLLDRRLGADERFVLRLRPAVPIIASPPEKGDKGVPASQEEDGEQPAGQENGVKVSGKADPAADQPKGADKQPAEDDDDEQRRP